MASRFKLNRRTFLKGISGGVLTTLALPPLEAMLNTHGTALADGTDIPKNLGVWFWGNGVRPELWKPESVGQGNAWALSPELAALSAHKSRLSVLTNFDIQRSGTGHHVGRAAILTGTYDQRKGPYGNPTGPSISRIASQTWRGLTPYESLDVGIALRGKANSRPTEGAVIDESGSFLPVERSPRAVFNRFFDNFSPTIDTARQTALRDVRTTMLDAIKGDASDLKQRLGAADKLRLDAHLQGIRDLENNLANYENSVCELMFGEPGGRDDFFVDMDPGKEDLRLKHAIMSEMIALALACDLTRTFSITFSTMQSDVVFHQIGATEGSHVLTHDDRGLDVQLDPQYGLVNRSVEFMMTCYADLLDRLAAIDVGAQTLLDQCCILTTSEINDGTRHTYDSMPIVIAGNAGGTLRNDIHIDGGGASTNGVLLSCLRAVDIDIPDIGDVVHSTDQDVGELKA